MNDSHLPRYALVTGGGSGLGQEFCFQLAAENWHVVVVDVDFAAAEQTVADLAAQGGSGQAEQLDVTDLQAWAKLVSQLKKSLPRIDLLVNNAGICSAGELGNTSIETFMRTIEVNLHGVLNGCHVMIPWLKESAVHGHIVNVSSIFGVISPPAMGAYNLSKAGVISISETLTGELASDQIGVTVVMPGFFETRLLKNACFDSKAQEIIATDYMYNAKITAKDVVKQTLEAIKQKKMYVVLGSKARWYWRLKRLMPRKMVRLVARRYQKKAQYLRNTD